MIFKERTEEHQIEGTRFDIGVGCLISGAKKLQVTVSTGAWVIRGSYG